MCSPSRTRSAAFNTAVLIGDVHRIERGDAARDQYTHGAGEARGIGQAHQIGHVRNREEKSIAHAAESGKLEHLPIDDYREYRQDDQLDAVRLEKIGDRNQPDGDHR